MCLLGTVISVFLSNICYNLFYLIKSITDLESILDDFILYATFILFSFFHFVIYCVISCWLLGYYISISFLHYFVL